MQAGRIWREVSSGAQRAADAALAAVILATSLVGVVSRSPEWSGPPLIEATVAAVCAVPLVWRRRQPVAVAALVGAGALAAGMLVAPTQGPFTVFVAYVVAIYSVGVHASTRVGLWTLGAVSAAQLVGWAVMAITVDGTYYGDWIPGIAWGIFAWIVGRVIRSRNRRTAELERLTEALAEEREARAREAVTVERARIARELHDVIAHNISVMGVQAAAALRVIQGEQPDVRRALETIEITGRQTVDEMRRMLGVLRHSDDELTLSPQPSLRDLSSLVQQVRDAGLDVDVTIEGDPIALPAGLDLSIYRIVQEALTNALKHAAPARVELVVRYNADTVEVEVSDNGKPATVAPPARGHGLVGMRERVALFGGEFHAGHRAEGGWALRAVLPVTAR